MVGDWVSEARATACQWRGAQSWTFVLKCDNLEHAQRENDPSS
jgi:hypothetical protein